MKSRSKFPPIVRFAFFVTFTVLVWVSFEVYRSIAIEPASPVPPHILEPLDPTLDSITLDELQRRIHLSEEEIGDTVLRSPEDGVIEEVEVTFPEIQESTSGGILN